MGQKKRILVVDDESSVLITYKMILEQQGYDVVASLNSKDALAAVAANDFDLLLCDFSLEEQHTGFEVIQAARQKNPRVPAALLTGYATRETVDQARADNIGVLFKPIDIQEFLQTTSTLLRNNDERSQNESAQEDDESNEEGRGTGRKHQPGRSAASRIAKG